MLDQFFRSWIREATVFDDVHLTVAFKGLFVYDYNDF